MGNLDTIDPVARAIILDGSSFSGVDIKAVVYLYETQQNPANLGTEHAAEILADTSKEIKEQFKKLAIKNDLISQYGPTFALRAAVNNIQRNIDDLRNIAAQVTFNTQSEKKVVPKVLAEIQTVSISTHREKFPVRSLGSIGPRGFTRGIRTVAGSLIFTVFDKQVLHEFISQGPADSSRFNSTPYSLADQLPPFDITLVMANEYGQESRMAIYGVELINEGMTMSIQDIFTESVCQFVALDIEPLNNIVTRAGQRGSMKREATQSAKKLLEDPSYVLELIRKRANPFL